MKSIKHILWDWNGTLINDVDLCVTALNTLLNRRSMTNIDRAYYQKHFGFPVIGFYEKLGFNFDEECFKTMCSEWMKEYQGGFSLETKLQNFTHEVLSYTDSLGFKQSILSACEISILKDSIKHFRLCDYFHEVHGTTNIQAHGKTELALEALKNSNYAPNETLLFGDTVHDYEVARDSGMHCVLIADGHQSEALLKSTGCTVLTTLSDVKNFLKTLNI